MEHNKASKFKHELKELGNIFSGFMKVVGFVLAFGLAINLLETGETFPPGTRLFEDILAPILGYLGLGVVVFLIFAVVKVAAGWWNERKSKK